MRLRDAMIAAIQHNASLAKLDRTDILCIRGDKFYSVEFRAKYGGQPEIRLNAKDCLSDDWYLVKEGVYYDPAGTQLAGRLGATGLSADAARPATSRS